MKIVTEKLDLRDTRDSRMGMVLILVFAEDTGAIQLMKEKGVISTEMIDSETMKKRWLDFLEQFAGCR